MKESTNDLWTFIVVVFFSLIFFIGCIIDGMNFPSATVVFILLFAFSYSFYNKYKDTKNLEDADKYINDVIGRIL